MKPEYLGYATKGIGLLPKHTDRKLLELAVSFMKSGEDKWKDHCQNQMRYIVILRENFI